MEQSPAGKKVSMETEGIVGAVIRQLLVKVQRIEKTSYVL
jgi:hypothetical protein